MHNDCVRCKNNLLCLSQGFCTAHIRLSCVGCGLSFIDDANPVVNVTEFALSCLPARIRGGWDPETGRFTDKTHASGRLLGRCAHCVSLETRIRDYIRTQPKLEHFDSLRGHITEHILQSKPQILCGPTPIKRSFSEVLDEKMQQEYVSFARRRLMENA